MHPCTLSAAIPPDDESAAADLVSVSWSTHGVSHDLSVPGLEQSKTSDCRTAVRDRYWPGFAPGTGGGVDRIRSIANGAPNLDHRGHHGETAPFPPV
jgi:hypothetical protein